MLVSNCIFPHSHRMSELSSRNQGSGVADVDATAGVNAQYNVARPGSLPVRLAHYQRRKMFAAFLEAAQPADTDTLLDIGATSDRSYDHSNYLVAWYPHKSQITAACIDEGAQFLESLYPGVTFA